MAATPLPRAAHHLMLEAMAHHLRKASTVVAVTVTLRDRPKHINTRNSTSTMLKRIHLRRSKLMAMVPQLRPSPLALTISVCPSHRRLPTCLLRLRRATMQP